MVFVLTGMDGWGLTSHSTVQIISGRVHFDYVLPHRDRSRRQRLLPTPKVEWITYGQAVEDFEVCALCGIHRVTVVAFVCVVVLMLWLLMDRSGGRL